jgi:hypothetical protein
MHFRHLPAMNSLSSWHGHHPNMSAYTPISEAYIDSSSIIRNHDLVNLGWKLSRMWRLESKLS